MNFTRKYQCATFYEKAIIVPLFISVHKKRKSDILSDFQHIDKSRGNSDILSELPLRIIIFLFIFPLSSMKTNEQIVIRGPFLLESLHFFN